MAIDWTHAGPTVLAAFLASLVEFVEALTIVLAVGAVRGWRGALGGTGLALLVLLALVVALGPALTQIPQDLVQLGVGTLILLFGMRWLRKAILRSAGVIPLHDEEAAFAKETASLRGLGGPNATRGQGWDRVAVSTAFKITMIEGIEVVFIVIALGAAGSGLLLPASFGALAALLLVVALGLALHRPVSMIPENTLKFVVGVLLCAFGTFVGRRGHGPAMARRGPVHPGAQRRVPDVGAAGCANVPGAGWHQTARALNDDHPVGELRMTWLNTLWSEFIGLFVDDGSFAVAILAWIAFCWLVLPRLGLAPPWPSAILFGGLALILVESALRRARQRA